MQSIVVLPLIWMEFNWWLEVRFAGWKDWRCYANNREINGAEIALIHTTPANKLYLNMWQAFIKHWDFGKSLSVHITAIS